MVRITAVILLWIFSFSLLFAQEEPAGLVADLPTIALTAKRLWISNANVQLWDSAAIASRQQLALSDLLGQESGSFVRSYGLGSLATATLRGAGSGQLKILWNGLPLESPMLGLLDLSQLHPFFFGGIRLEVGGGSGAYGSGAIAGVIHLDGHEIVATPSFSLSLDGGAMERAGLRGHCYFVSQNKQWAYRSTLSALRTENNFRYFDLRNDAWTRQRHASQRQYGFQQEIYFNPNERETWTFRIWGQHYSKEIPASAAQRNGSSSQKDNFVRTSLHYQRKTEKLEFQLRSGLFRETIDFSNDAQGISSETAFWKGLFEPEWNWSLSAKTSLTVGLANEWIAAEAPAYGQIRQQFRNAPFVSIGYKNTDWYWQLTARQDWADGQLMATSPSAQLGWRFVGDLSISAKVSRDFRLPTLNDRYWQPGGNPNLKAERGWSQELSLNYQKTQVFNASITGFHRLLNDWIQWAPAPDEPFWMPRNLTRVRSYGLEGKWRGETQIGENSLVLQLGANYVRSINLVAVQLPRLNADEQLAYTPEWTGNGRLSLKAEHWELIYAHQYVGTRRNNSRETMEAYWPARFTSQKSIQLTNGLMTMGLSIENLWNQNYRVLEGFRMPGRYVQGNLTYAWRRSR